MLFSSPELLELEEQDYLPLSVFMEACMSYVPEKRRRVLEDSFKELNIIDEDTGESSETAELAVITLLQTRSRCGPSSATCPSCSTRS